MKAVRRINEGGTEIESKDRKERMIEWQKVN